MIKSDGTYWTRVVASERKWVAVSDRRNGSDVDEGYACKEGSIFEDQLEELFAVENSSGVDFKKEEGCCKEKKRLE